MRDRTADLLHAMQALSQLSYSPVVLDGAHIRAPTNFCQQINSIKQRLKGKGLIFRGLRARAVPAAGAPAAQARMALYPSEPRSDRKSTRLNSSHVRISYAVFCLKKKK